MDPTTSTARASWTHRHPREAAAAERWLDEVLGTSVTPTSPGTGAPDPDWTIEVRPAGEVLANHGPSGATVTATLVLRADRPGARLRVLRYGYAVPEGLASDGPPPPISQIESAVNEPATLQRALDTLGDPPAATAVERMKLPPVLLRRRPRSDDFYAHVAALVRVCESRGVPYGSQLARDNGVSEGTVRSWAHEARRRGLLAAPRRGRTAQDPDRGRPA